MYRQVNDSNYGNSEHVRGDNAQPNEDSRGPELMIWRLVEQVIVGGPLKIDEVGYPNPEVTFSGPDWSLGVICSWHLLLNGSVVVAPDEMTQPFEVITEIVDDAIWDLIGHEIVGVRKSPSNLNDPIFELTGGYAIEVAADADPDPWALALSKVVFVGTMEFSSD